MKTTTENLIAEIKNIVKANGEVDLQSYEVEILLHKAFGTELSNYNYNVIASMGCIKLSRGKQIVEILENGCIVKQDGLGEEYDLVVMDYTELSDIVLSKILFYLVMIEN